MVMTKKDFKELATMIGESKAQGDYEGLIEDLIRFCHGQNGRFDECRFRDWVDRIANNESTVGLG